MCLAAVVAAGAIAGSGCSVAGAGGGGGAGPRGVALRVAIVANPQMQDVETLTSAFEKQNPDIKVNYVTLPENESRAKITASVSTKSNEFDVVMISNYETPMWARYGWITNLQPYISAHARLRRGRLHPLDSRRALLPGDACTQSPSTASPRS